MDREKLEAKWDVEQPKADFAERVAERALGTPLSSPDVQAAPAKSSFVRRRFRGWRLAAAAAVVAAIVGLAFQWRGFFPQRGSAVAVERTTRTLDGSSVAVLEPEAEIAWLGRVVTQASGDVFYRVEPGRGAFRVETPAGRVEVFGTCFRVKVFTGQKEERAMETRRWGTALAVGAAGAALGSVTTVTVYEGQTRLVREMSSVVLQAGQSGVLDQRGARHIEGDVKSALASPRGLDSAAQSGQAVPLSPVKVAALEREKKDLEAQLRTLESALEKQKPKRDRNDFDLNQEDWKNLAAKGRVKFRIPCLNADPTETFRFNRVDLDKLGFRPEDSDVLTAAYKKSNERLWSVLRPLCVEAVGKAELADTLGGMACFDALRTISKRKDPKAAAEAFQMVADVRAGLRPLPNPAEPTHPLYTALMAITGEMPKFEADLAESFGPEEAKRVAWGPGCLNVLTLDEGTNRPPTK